MLQSVDSKKAVIYICAISDEIGKIQKKLSNHAKDKGFEVVESFLDSHPSSRPALRHFLQSTESIDIDAVVVMQLWELGFSVSGLLKNLQQLLDNEIRIIAGGQEILKEQITIIKSVLESEKVYRTQHSNSGQQKWIQAGNRVGRPKAKFSLTDALALRAKGNMSPTQISKVLMKRGQVVSPTTLRRRFSELESTEV